MQMTQHRLYGLRGKAFVTECKRLFRDPGTLRDEIISAYLSLVRTHNGKFTPLCLGKLCMTFQIPISVMDDWLPDITKDLDNLRYPSGTWQRLKDKGVKAKDIGVEWK